MTHFKLKILLLLNLKIFANVLILVEIFAKFNHFAEANFTFQVALHLI